MALIDALIAIGAATANGSSASFFMLSAMD
jgi:hypothetical protein